MRRTTRAGKGKPSPYEEVSLRGSRSRPGTRRRTRRARIGQSCPDLTTSTPKPGSGTAPKATTVQIVHLVPARIAGPSAREIGADLRTHGPTREAARAGLMTSSVVFVTALIMARATAPPARRPQQDSNLRSRLRRGVAVHHPDQRKRVPAHHDRGPIGGRLFDRSACPCRSRMRVQVVAVAGSSGSPRDSQRDAAFRSISGSRHSSRPSRDGP
jgi:hypothetical protein